MSTITDINASNKFNWIIDSCELSTKITVKASNPWEAMEEAIKAHPHIETFTLIVPEDDDVEWLDEWENPSEGLAVVIAKESH